MSERQSLPENIKIEIIARSNNACCICQIPFIVIHHIDHNPSNNNLDNLIGLCPNHHSLAHASGGLANNLRPQRLTILRDKWYEYCENRREFGAFNDFSEGRLKIRELARRFEYPTFGWKKTFGCVDKEYENMNRDEIIDRLFSTSNRNKIKVYLENVYMMYKNYHDYQAFIEKFSNVCEYFGFDAKEIIGKE